MVRQESRRLEEEETITYVKSIREAVEYLEKTSGNILVTTGSKELSAYTALTDYQERIYARVLSLPSVVEACQKLGFEGKHLIAMQGPFSKEMNEATLRQYECQYLVTKDSGKAGGFGEAAELYGTFFGTFYFVNGVGNVFFLYKRLISGIEQNQSVVGKCVVHPFFQLRLG